MRTTHPVPTTAGAARPGPAPRPATTADAPPGPATLHEALSLDPAALVAPPRLVLGAPRLDDLAAVVPARRIDEVPTPPTRRWLGGVAALVVAVVASWALVVGVAALAWALVA
jgi:hypothetical protein